MTTYLESNPGQLPNFITTLARFPANKVDPSLLSIIESAMDGVIVVDAQRHIVLVNQKAERIFGYSADNLMDKSLDILLPHRLGNEQKRRIDRLSSARFNERRARVELKGLHANGEQLVMDTSITRVAVHGEMYLALILHTATARRPPNELNQRPVGQADLRKWAASSQQATEVEKRRFSKKLYDDIGQRLSVLKLDLDWLENSLPDTDGGLPARVAQMQGLLDNVITMTKSMASALRPPLLDDFGLLAAAEWMADSFQKRSGIACTVETEGKFQKLDDAIESAVFRVIQESLSNIERHSHAGTAKIAFAHTDHQLNVMIQDDGIGMEPGNEHKPDCYGLIAMQERIFVLGGTISIRNAEPHGVIIQASIPIEPIFPIEQPNTPPASSL